MLLPHESTVPHMIPMTADTDTSSGAGTLATQMVETGQEPGTTHDMDDDDIDFTEDTETSSDQSN